MADLIQIITATDSEDEAYEIARILLESRLVACVTIAGPVRSAYWWQGKIDQATEWQCVIKTRADLFDQVEELILNNHSYDIPEIVALPVLGANEEYQSWLEGEMKS